MIVLGALARIGFLLVSLLVPLGCGRAAGFWSHWSVAGLAWLGHLDRGRLVLLELRVPLRELPVLLASRDAHILVDGGAGLATLQGGVHLGCTSSGERNRGRLGLFLSDFDCMSRKVRYHGELRNFLRYLIFLFFYSVCFPRTLR